MLTTSCFVCAILKGRKRSTCTEVTQSLLSVWKKQLAPPFNFTYRHIEKVLSINNKHLANYLGKMNPVELEIKNTVESNISASYLDLLSSIGRDDRLHACIKDKRDDFILHITHFPFLCSSIPSSPVYDVFIKQLIRYVQACLLLMFILYSGGQSTFQ